MTREKEQLSQQPIVERMSESDLSEVINLGLSSAEADTGTDSPQFYSKETLSRWVQSPNGVLLVARVEGKFAGFILTAYNPDSNDAYIHEVAVTEQFRGRGVADKLLDQTLTALEKTACDHVFCLTKPSNNPAQKLLQKHGFAMGDTFLYADRMLPRKAQ